MIFAAMGLKLIQNFGFIHRFLIQKRKGPSRGIVTLREGLLAALVRTSQVPTLTMSARMMHQRRLLTQAPASEHSIRRLSVKAMFSKLPTSDSESMFWNLATQKYLGTGKNILYFYYSYPVYCVRNWLLRWFFFSSKWLVLSVKRDRHVMEFSNLSSSSS